MILAFVDDQTVSVLEDEAAARAEFEAIDVENRDVVFYRDDGVWLEPQFSGPRSGSFKAPFPQGTFALIPSPERSPKTLDEALAEAVAINPNPRFTSLATLREHVRTQTATAPK